MTIIGTIMVCSAWGGLLDEIVAEKDKSCRVIFRGGIEVTI